MAILRTLLDGILYAFIFLLFAALFGVIGHFIIKNAYVDLFLSSIYIFIFLQWFFIVLFNSVVFAFIKKAMNANYKWLSIFWETFVIGALCVVAVTIFFSAVFQISGISFSNTTLDIFLLLMNWHEKVKIFIVVILFLISYSCLFTVLKVIIDRIVWRKYAKIL